MIDRMKITRILCSTLACLLAVLVLHAAVPEGISVSSADIPLTALTLTASKTSPQAVYASMTLTATPTGGSNLEYKFLAARLVNSTWSWQVLQNFSAAGTSPWRPTRSGSYWLRVQAREVGSPNAYDRVADCYFTINPIAFAKIELDISKPSPQPVASALTLTAVPMDNGNYQYEFSFMRQTSPNTWEGRVLQDFNTGNTCPWTPTIAGYYRLTLRARQVGTTTPVYTKTCDYTVSASTLVSVALGTWLPSPATVNSALSLTATPIGGFNLEYKFYAARQVSGIWHWTVLRDYGTANTCPWTPALAGSYWLRVLAREVGSPNTYDKAGDMYYTVVPALSAVELTADELSPQPAGVMVGLTATPTGGSHQVYKFYVGRQVDSTWKWSVLRDFSYENTCPWRPMQAGSYWLRVIARDVSGDKTADLYFTIDPVAIPEVSLTADAQSPQPANTALTLTAAADGNNLEYKFYVAQLEYTTWKWRVLQDFSAQNTCPWTPAQAGSYWLRVLVREVGSPNPYDQVADLYYTVNP